MPEGKETSAEPGQGSGAESTENSVKTSEGTAAEEKTSGEETSGAEGTAEEKSTEAPSGEGKEQAYKGFASKEEHDAHFAEDRRRAKLDKELGLNPAKPAEGQTEGETLKIDPNSPEAKKALETLKSLGVITKADLDAERARDQFFAESATLEKKYDGADGNPKFDTVAVAKFGKENKIFDLEAAYLKMHFGDIVNNAIKKAGGKSAATEVATGAGAAATSGQGAKIEDIMKMPEGQAKIEAFKRFTNSLSVKS